MKTMTKFKELKKGDQIFRIINVVFMVLQFLACIGMGIYYLTIGDPENRVFSCFGIAVLVILPYLAELIFRFRLPGLIFLFYQLYVLFAGFIGSVLNVYYLASWYDLIIHTLAGYVFALLGIFVVSRLENYSKLNKWTIVIFCFCLSLACELIWELLEWFVDNCLGQTAQGPVAEGYNAPLVTDTMVDILCNFCGAIVFSVQYIIGKSTKATLGTKFFEKQLVKEKSVATADLSQQSQLIAETASEETIGSEETIIDKIEDDDNS